MLAYAASRSTIARRRSSPNAMLAIIAVHVALTALVMSAKMDLPQRVLPTPTFVEFIRQPQPSEPAERIKPRVPQQPAESRLDQPPAHVPTPPTGDQTADAAPSLPDGLAVPGVEPGASADPLPLPQPVNLQASLLTPAAELRPPYPLSKLASGEEGVLRLRLTIDERGRVIAVELVGRADKVFLEAARRHLLAHWRYRPASEGGRAVTSSTVITLRFQLDG